MNIIEKIKEFLKEKPGYLKEGGKRLRNHLLKRGIKCTTEQCKIALREVRQELTFSPVPSSIENPKILFFDIEVSYGLAKAWRPSYKYKLNYGDFISHPKIICISYKWSDDDTVYTVHWDKNQDDKTLLELFIPELNKADFVVAHNGDKFDLPWIRTRALYHDLEMYPKYTSVDTLKVCRYYHKLPSNRLNDIGEYFGLGEKIPTDMSLWDRVILNKEPKALEEMIEYCEQDVKLLEAVYDKLAKHTLPTVHNGTLQGKEKTTSPYSGSTNIETVRKTTTKAGTIKWLMKCNDTGKFFEMSNASYKKLNEDK